MSHGTEPALAGAMAVRAPFPPTSADARYVYEFRDARAVADSLRARWRDLFHESLAAAGLARDDLGYALFHQTHVEQVQSLVADLGLDPARVPMVVVGHGSMGTPTFAVALARVHAKLWPGCRYLLQAVGGGVSWCAIVAEHR